VLAVSVSASSAPAQPTPTDPGHASARVRACMPGPSLRVAPGTVS